jgi:hypothetical protein
MTISLIKDITRPPNSLQNLNQTIVDKRVRLRSKIGQENRIYGNPRDTTNPLKIFYETNGLIFPYTPLIDISQKIGWSSQALVHSLQDFYYFKSIPSIEISISGKFTAQNIYQGQYLFAVLHFLRSYSKMNFGLQEDPLTRGLPPPVLLLDMYGVFSESIPVIIHDWRFSLPSEVSYVKIILGDNSQNTRSGNNTTNLNLGNLSKSFTNNLPIRYSPKSNYVYLPAVTEISVNLIVQHPPTKLKREFNLQHFREGKYLGTKKGFI